MIKKLSAKILKMNGWKLVVTVPEPPKSVICVAPHTSNRDFFIGKLSYWSLGRQSSFLIKKSWFFFPMNFILSALGGVPIDRSKKSSVTDQMAEEFDKRSTFHLAITPEGTRGFVSKWKMGFYYIAIKANVPIQLAYLDFGKKEMGIKKVFYPTGNEEADMLEIFEYYRQVKARFPAKFNIGYSSQEGTVK